MRTCTKCGVEKQWSAFFNSRRTRDGLRSACKPCTTAQSLIWQRSHKDKVKEYDRRSHARNPVRRAEVMRACRLKRKYGLTRASYADMVAAQAGACAICWRVRKLYVDHDHATGFTRGLLCQDCNIALGLARDNPAILRAAADYVEIPLPPHGGIGNV